MAEDEVSLDFETFSRADLKKCGAHRYAEHESTDILCMAYAFNDEEPELWLPGDSFPARLRRHIERGGIINAWNAQFERLLWKHVGVNKYGFPPMKLRQWRCTMVRSYAMGLPGSLDAAAQAIKMNIRKDAEGSAVMRKLCKPRKDGSIYDPKRYQWMYSKLYEYCRVDVKVERQIGRVLLPLSADEQELYFVDQRINDRGVFIDIDLVNAAEEIVGEELRRLDKEIRDVSGGRIKATSAVEQIKNYLVRNGLDIDDLRKDDVQKLLDRDDLLDDERRILELRQEAGKTSTAKLRAFKQRRSRDGRVKGTLQFHGAASTGRWAARGVQLQNLPRPDIKNKTNIPEAAKAIRLGDIDLLREKHGPPMTVIADCLRYMIMSPQGRILWSQDLKQIEARMLPWLAGDHKTLKVFREYDAKRGPDLYKVTAATGVYGKPHEQITKDERQVGKVAALALGFGGGANAFDSMAKIYGIDMGLIYDQLCDIATDEEYEKAHAAYKKRGRKTGVSKRKWVAAEIVKLRWRKNNPEIVQFWYDLEEAAIRAIERPGKKYSVGYITYEKTGSFLRCRLPSGRCIYYPFASVKVIETEWGSEKKEIHYWSMGSNNKWAEQKAYGGLFAENVTQAAARDVAAEGVFASEDAGYETILLVHDEAVAETDDDFGDEKEFNDLISASLDWCPGLPIAADGWRDTHYKKGD